MMTTPSTPLYRLEGVGKEYDGPGEELVILKGLDLTIEAGESVAIVGASGSGKSTLLHLLGALDTPTWGKLHFLDRDMGAMSPEEKAAFRNREIGFVFQFHHLLPEFSTVENVAMQAIISGMPHAEAYGLAREALDKVGLSGRVEHKVTTLSGGERQRAAIARAILLRPRVLLADEPTGNLDATNGQAIIDLLFGLRDRHGATLVMVTHSAELAARCARTIRLRDGRIDTTETRREAAE